MSPLPWHPSKLLHMNPYLGACFHTIPEQDEHLCVLSLLYTSLLNQHQNLPKNI